MKERINQKKNQIIFGAFNQFLNKHSLDENCNCELCKLDLEIRNINLQKHKINKFLDNYYTVLPMSDIVIKRAQLHTLEYNIKVNKDKKDKLIKQTRWQNKLIKQNLYKMYKTV